MPSRTLRVEPELFLEHAGVRVYRTYADDDFDQPDPFVFTTDPGDTDSASPRAFDVREWADLTVGRPPLVDDEHAALRGMPLADYTRTPEYLALRVLWDAWWDQTLPGLVRQAVIAAIDGGNIN